LWPGEVLEEVFDSVHRLNRRFHGFLKHLVPR
jgi:hypothetical protein